jgi:hypothetical protein
MNDQTILKYICGSYWRHKAGWDAFHPEIYFILQLYFLAPFRSVGVFELGTAVSSVWCHSVALTH